jgi:hypothetical protein
LARERYRVPVTNVTQEPLALVYVDAITGDVLSMTVAESESE